MTKIDGLLHRGALQRAQLSRFSFRDGAWYVELRGRSEGPFVRREDAERFLTSFLRSSQGR